MLSIRISPPARTPRSPEVLRSPDTLKYPETLKSCVIVNGVVVSKFPISISVSANPIGNIEQACLDMIEPELRGVPARVV